MVQEKEFLKQMGSKIRALRKLYGMSQYELAITCQMDESNLCDIELGKKDCQILTLKRFADALKVDVKYFL